MKRKKVLPAAFFAVILFFLVFISSSIFAIESASTAFIVDVMSIGSTNGSATLSSTNFISELATIGETFTVDKAENEILGDTFRVVLNNLRFYTTTSGVTPLLISELKAREGILGEFISEKTWQKDSSPYFYWTIVTEPKERVTGFSVSLDEQPDLLIDITESFYQYPQQSLSSGKHIFYVLPFTSGGISEQSNQLSFEIWVDTDTPVSEQMSPASGSALSSKDVQISCVLDDRDSGIDADTIVLTLNGQNINFTYDGLTKLLKAETALSFIEGENTVFLRARDNVGNYLTKAWTFTVDTLPPEGKIMLNSGAEVTYSAYVNVNVEASDAISEIKSIYLSNDGIFDAELNIPFTYSQTILAWLLAEPDTDGLKTVYAMFEDSCGNRSSKYSASIALKLMTPDTRIVSGPAAATDLLEASFVFEASKPACSFKYRLDNQDWSEWASSDEIMFNSLVEGNHYFYVKSGFDANQDGEITIDEEDPTPALWVWTIGSGELLERLRKTLFWRR